MTDSLAPLLRRHWRRLGKMFAPLLLLSLFINLAGLIPALFMLQVYDRVLTSQNVTTLVLLLLITLAGLGVGAILEHLRSRALIR